MNVHPALAVKCMPLSCHIVAGHEFFFNQPLGQRSIQAARDRIFQYTHGWVTGGPRQVLFGPADPLTLYNREFDYNVGAIRMQFDF